MTTEPKHVRGGDEAKRSALSPSDPPPVRGAVAWLYTEHRWKDGPRHRLSMKRQAVSDEDINEFEITETALYADPLPVSREAVLMEALEHLRECVKLVPAPGAIEAAERFLALTGETSRE